MSGTVSINPLLTSVAGGSFNIDSTGYVQGTASNDPSVRNFLTVAALTSTETLPMWGGVGIFELLGGATTGYPNPHSVGRANSLTGANALTGFSVFDQAHAMINSPQSPVPLAPVGGTVSFYRLGTGARIAVACDPALVSLDGGIITAQVSWDFVGQRLVPYVAAYPANVITAATWASTAGGQATLTTTSAHGLSVGSDFAISGITPSAYNGTFTAIAGTTGSTIVYALPLTSTPGSGTVFGTLAAGGGALNVRVLDVLTSGNMTVSYNATTGFANWNRSGPAALILI